MSHLGLTGFTSSQEVRIDQKRRGRMAAESWEISPEQLSKNDVALGIAMPTILQYQIIQWTAVSIRTHV
ncbi:hypothetical protein ACT18_23615 [Mycolicibacter kumamotonensis]|uniref:Uncharacterized protein n=1 Tax=Mycolicibacter kumamotonensis TaxID=354243 RepID=A0A1B8S9A6_9MYCO|nr:hypothetical protein ACT18_23615 [Mycolicibacter kumamotonensis]